MPGAPGSLLLPTSLADTPAPQAGGSGQPRRPLQPKTSENNAQSAPSRDNDSGSADASGIPMQNESPGPASQEPDQDAQQSYLSGDAGRVRVTTNSPETIPYDLRPDANSETVDSGLKQTSRTVTSVTTTTTKVEERKGTDVQKTGQPTTSREGTTQPRRDLSIPQTTTSQQRYEVQTYSAQGGLEKKASFYHETRPRTVSSASVSVEHRRSSVLSRSSGIVIEDSLFEIQHLHRQETDQMLLIMKARLKQHQENELVHEEQLEAFRTENERLVRQVSASASEITLLKIQLNSSVVSRPGSLSSHELDSTVTTTITIVTTTITTVTTRIEQWRDEVVRNKGQITISRTDLDRLLSDLSNTSSQMTKLQQAYTEMSQDSISVRRRLEVTLELCDEKDRTITILTDEDGTKARQIATLRKDNELLRRDFSAASSEMKELQRRYRLQSEELVSANEELNAKVLLIEENDRSIASFTTQVTELQRSNDEKTKQIATARREYEKLQKASSSQIAELQKRYDALSEERDSLRNELRDSKTLVEEKESRIVVLITEVEKWKGVATAKTEQLDAERQEKEKLQKELAALNSEMAKLQQRCDARSKEIDSLGSELRTKGAQLAGQEHTITSLTVDLEQARRKNDMQEQLIAAARQDAEQLRQKLSVALDEKADLQKRFDAQLRELNNLHNELDRLKIIGDPSGGGDIAEGITRALEKKEKQVEELRQGLAAITSQYNDLRISHEALSSKFSTLSDELKVKTSQYEGVKDTITSLTTQVNQLRATDADKTDQLATAHNQVRELKLEVTTLTSQLTELQGRHGPQSEELISVKNQLQTLTSSIEEKDGIISSITAERDQQVEQIAKLQRELSVFTSQLTELQGYCRTHLDELASVRSELEISKSSIQEKERKVTALTGEVEELERTNTSNDKRIADTRKQVEDLRQELTDSRSQIAKLQHDNQMQSTKIVSLQKTLEATKSGDNATIASLTAQVEEWKEKCTTKGDELMTARRDLEQLRHELDASSTRYAELEQKLTSQIKQLQQLDATTSAELTAVRAELTTARAELEQLRREISTLTSKIDKYQQDYAAQSAELTSQIDQWKRSHDAKEEELTTERKRLEQLKHRFDDLSSQTTKLKQGCQTHSAELKFLQEQFSVMPPDSTVEEWSITQKKIMAEVKEYTDVIRLTTIVDDWMGADAKRAEVLALELEKRNKENEELRHKLVTLKEIYIRAPRLKQIFQSETIEIKRRYQEESNALKVALAESQSQLRGVQRVVATADTYADEMIIAMLKKLNAEVQQNTTYMAEHMAEDFRTTKGTKEQISATQIVSKSIGKTMADCLASMERDDVELYLQIAFQAYFSYYLLRIISSWTIEKGHNDFINAIYEQLQKAETQPMSGRWRSLTRAYISPTWMSNPSSLTQQIVADLSDVVVAAGCAASATAANLKLSSFRDKVLSIISIAGQFSEMIGKVVSADFAVTAPPPLQVFEETTMEQDVDDYDKDQGKASGTAVGQKVLCSTQLGMTKRMQREPGRETLTVIKAKVVLETFLDG